MKRYPPDGAIYMVDYKESPDSSVGWFQACASALIVHGVLQGRVQGLSKSGSLTTQHRAVVGVANTVLLVERVGLGGKTRNRGRSAYV